MSVSSRRPQHERGNSPIREEHIAPSKFPQDYSSIDNSPTNDSVTVPRASILSTFSADSQSAPSPIKHPNLDNTPRNDVYSPPWAAVQSTR